MTHKIATYFKSTQGMFIGSFVGMFILFFVLLIGLGAIFNNEAALIVPIFLLLGFFIFWGIIFPIWKFVKAFNKEGFGLFTRFYNYLYQQIKALVQSLIGLAVGGVVILLMLGIGLWLFGKAVETYKDWQIPSKWTLFYYASADDFHEATSKVPGYDSKSSCLEAGLGLVSRQADLKRGAWYECGYKCRNDYGIIDVCKEVCDNKGNCSN